MSGSPVEKSMFVSACLRARRPGDQGCVRKTHHRGASSLPFGPSEVVSGNRVLWPATPLHSLLMVRRQEGAERDVANLRGWSESKFSAGFRTVSPKDTDCTAGHSQSLLPGNRLHSSESRFSGQRAVDSKYFKSQNVVKSTLKRSTNDVLPKEELKR